MTAFLRHGDLNFNPISEEKFAELKGKNKEHKHDGAVILQHGETTGHKHVLTATKQDIEIVELAGGNWAFRLKTEATLTHEDHKTIVIPPGTYEMTREREVDHFAESIVRQVID